MNRNALIVLTIAFCFFISFCVGLLNYNFSSKTIASYRSEYLGQKRLHLSQVVGSLRNEILNSNFRYVRNYLEKLKYEGLFEEFRILDSNGKLLEKSADSKKEHVSALYIPVYFSKGGKKWGSFNFLIDQGPLNKIEKSFDYYLLMSVFLSIIFILFSVFCLNFIYFNTSKSLIYLMRDRLDNKITSTNKLFRYIFTPLVNLSEKIIGEINEKSIALRKMEQNQIYYDLAQSVAHDMRSPISSLQSTLALISRDPERSKVLLSRSIDRISNIADELLSAPKLIKSEPNPYRQDKLEKVSCTADLKGCSLEIISEKRQFLPKDRNVKLIFYDEHPEVNLVLAERPKVLRVLSNIIDNAVESITDDGFVTVTKTAYGHSLSIEIRDNGCGLSEEDLNLLRSSPQTLKKANGNGLGLKSAISYMASIGGQLIISSTLNQGTTVTLQFKTAIP